MNRCGEKLCCISESGDGFDQAEKNLHADISSTESAIYDSLEGICSQDHYSMMKKQRINIKYL